MTTTLQIRIDTAVKKRARSAFKEAGLDMSSGVKLYLAEVARRRAVPFGLFTADALPEKKKRALRKEIEAALKSGTRYKNIHALHKAIK